MDNLFSIQNRHNICPYKMFVYCMKVFWFGFILLHNPHHSDLDIFEKVSFSSNIVLHRHDRRFNHSSGCDERFPINNPSDDSAFLSHMANLHQKQALLKKIENPHISNLTKLDWIQQNTEYSWTFNPFAGGLLDDWNKDL